MHLFLLGISHRTAPIALRERLDFASHGLAEALAELERIPEVSEAVVLATCNRAEVYAATDNLPAVGRALRGFFSTFHHVAEDDLAPHFYERADEDVARHLFRVSAGLESMVVGEPQILGQVKSAFHLAADRRAAGSLLNRLFHHSFAVGKRVRADTGLGEGAVSVSYAAVSLARKIFGILRERSVLVIGAGEMGKLTARHLQAQGISSIRLTSRTLAHGAAAAEHLGATAIPWGERHAALADADIVVTATGAAQPVVTTADVAAAVGSRRNRPLFIIDIAVPRDVEPSAGEIEQVFLYNVDDLQAIVRENLTRRGGEVERAESIVDDEVARFMAWLHSRGVVPTIVALRRRFEDVRRAELRRLDGKLSGLPPEARARVDEITRLLVEKLVLTPTEQLKSLTDSEKVIAYSDALGRLFNLGADDQAAAPADLADDLGANGGETGPGDAVPSKGPTRA
jgi:glutamyl-tRNA reductase